MNKEYNCLVCKHFNLDNIEIDYHNAMIRFCQNEGAKLKVCPYFVLNEAKYNAKRFEPSSNVAPIHPSSTTSEMNKILEFLCKLAKEKNIVIEFGGGLCDDKFPSFRVRQYRNNPKTDKVYTVCRIIDIDDLTIKNVGFKEFINELSNYFDREFNEMFEKRGDINDNTKKR